MAYGVRPVPQNIMSVQFKIMDFMTLRQFGITIGLLLFCMALFALLPTPWKFIIPIFIIIIGGIVIFVPFNGEPFQEFLSSYMEAIISPQRRVWHKKGIIVKSAAEKAKFYRYGNDPIPEDENKFKFVDPNQIQVTPQVTVLDNAENQFLSTQQKVTISHQMPNTQQQVNNSGTNISNSTIKNSININKFMHQSQQGQPIFQQQPQVANTQNQFQDFINQNTPQSNSNPIGQPESNILITQTGAQNSPQINITQTNLMPSFVKKEIPNASQVQPLKKTKEDYEADESAVKNYIFGSIEDYKDNPVKQAGVILKEKTGNNLEVLYSNSAGEFKTNYEYKQDEYIIYVNVDSKDFNEVKIIHEPIDPIPFVIHPKDYEDRKSQNQVQADTDKLANGIINNGVFEGAYDSKIFNLGHDYLENKVLLTPQNADIVEVSTIPIQEAQPVSANDIIPVETQAANSTKSSAYSFQANNMFNQMTNGRTSNDYAEVLKENEADQAPPPQVTVSQQQYVQAPVTVQSQPTQQPVTNDIDIVDYLSMPNANIPFENELVLIPNTLNGILVGPNGYGLDNCQLRIIDKLGQLVNSIKSDQTGRFYSYSPLPNGNYTLFISKNNQTLVGFYILLNGSVIPPKYINFSY